MDDTAAAIGELRHAGIYTNHLFIAEFVRGWAEFVLDCADREVGVNEVEYLKGYARALDDVAGHLERGEALPGGPVYLKRGTITAERSYA
ncbi:MAG: hypothetical protein Q4G43_09200 [Mobilicoccus sp.]|nr:hypothetical protein [Mobilicoccus sp.]